MAEGGESLLKISNSSVLPQFLHDCVDDLVGIKQANFNNYNSDIEWTIDDFNKAKRVVQNMYRQSVINDSLEFEANLGDNLENEVKKCLEIRKNDIFQALTKEKLVNNGHNLVDNIDWRLKWVLGNSSLASMREALVQVDLHYLKAGQYDKVNRATVNFEANLETLESLIEQLERVSKELTINK